MVAIFSVSTSLLFMQVYDFYSSSLKSTCTDMALITYFFLQFSLIKSYFSSSSDTYAYSVIIFCHIISNLLL